MDTNYEFFKTLEKVFNTYELLGKKIRVPEDIKKDGRFMMSKKKWKINEIDLQPSGISFWLSNGGSCINLSELHVIVGLANEGFLPDDIPFDEYWFNVLLLLAAISLGVNYRITNLQPGNYRDIEYYIDYMSFEESESKILALWDNRRTLENADQQEIRDRIEGKTVSKELMDIPFIEISSYVMRQPVQSLLAL